jgi:hypothetical protein
MRTTLYLKGQVIDEPKFLREEGERQIFTFSIRTADMECFPVRMWKGLMEKFEIEKGKTVHFSGHLQSFVEKSSGKNSLYHSCDMIEWRSDDDRLLHTFHGYICKEPIYRTTPFNREISDVLIAVNRAYNKSDYIPCIAWGRNARFVKNLKVGDFITISGRIQSREYQKKYSEMN